MNEKRFFKKVIAAQKRVESFDKIDGEKDRNLLTILFALEAGLKEDIDCAFDAYIMLKEITDGKSK